MEERRQTLRTRTYLGGTIVFNHRKSSMDCLVRNMSQNGAKITFSGTAAMPGEFDIMIRQKGESRRACIVWRSETAAGIAFGPPDEATVVSIESARQIRKLKEDREALLRRIAELSDPA